MLHCAVVQRGSIAQLADCTFIGGLVPIAANQRAVNFKNQIAADLEPDAFVVKATSRFVCGLCERPHLLLNVLVVLVGNVEV